MKEKESPLQRKKNYKFSYYSCSNEKADDGILLI